MAIAVKTYMNLSGLNNLAVSMFGHKKVYWIPKEKWVFLNGRYKKKIFVDPKISKNLDIWQGEPVTDIYSMETCMIDYGWIKEAKRKGIKVHDIPMIEWVESSKFYSKKYKVFDSIICLNDYCYKIFSSEYNNVTKRDVNFLYKDKKNFKKNNIVYHQSSVHSENNYKNTENCILAFLESNSKKYKMIITGKISKKCKNLCDKSNGSIDYLGVVSSDKVNSIYKISKYLLAPSLQEGLGMSLYESKNYGCKVITTDFSPMKEVGDFLCKTEVGQICGKFMYPKLNVEKKSILDILNALLI